MKIGFIGIGNMSKAIIDGMDDKSSIIISGRTYKSTLLKATELGVEAAKNHRDCVEQSDIIILGVKPEIILDILFEIKPFLKTQTLVSIAAKVSLQTLITTSSYSNIIRVMPNLNVTIKKGTTAIVIPDSIPNDHKQIIQSLFLKLGDLIHIDENQMSGFIGLAGSLPAFVFKFIDAIAQTGLRHGFTYEEALNLVTSTVCGSSEYVKKSSLSPSTLTQNVCSPGGTTIEGVTVLNQNNFEAILIDAVEAVIEKDKKGIPNH